MTIQNNIYPELFAVQNEFLNALKHLIRDLKWESESKEYHACRFKYQGSDFVYRKAKITPTKTGQFVTIWKRSKEGTIVPYGEADPIDFLMVYTPAANNSGFFLFPKNCLINYAILASENMSGKLGFRVYPPWDITTSKQAMKTKEWQDQYFFDLSKDDELNKNHFQNILIPFNTWNSMKN